MTLFSFGLMVLSSVVAAWADIKHALESHSSSNSAAATQQLATLNAGYLWMLVNCLSNAAYVLCMRKRIKLTNFKDFDSKFCFQISLVHVLTVASNVLQQLTHHSRSAACLFSSRGLVIRQFDQELPTKLKEWDLCCNDFHRRVIHFHFVHIGMVRASDILDDLFHGWRTEQTSARHLRPHLLRCARHDS